MSEGNVPEVRFRGFNGEWVNDTLGEITDVYDGTHQTPKYTEYGIMFLSVENIKTLQSEKYISEDDFINDFKIFPQKNDVLMTRIGDVGTANVIDNDAKKAYYVSLALLKYKKVNPYFLRESIHSQPVKREIWHRTLHIAFPKKINKNEIEKVNILFPNEAVEQTKIGEFFQNLDDLIAQNQKKYDKLVNMKKACLDKMFPKDGADTPEVRFKGFSGEWKRKTLGDFGAVSMNKRIYKYQTTDNGDIPFYKIGTFGKKADSFITKELFQEYKTKYPYPKLGDILISASGSIGRTVVYKGKYEYYQDSNIVWLNHSDDIINSFLLQFYILVKWSGLEGSTIKRLYNKNILETEIYAPNVAVQTKIGTFFQTLDHLIALRKTELEKLKNIKKACLDKMFI